MAVGDTEVDQSSLLHFAPPPDSANGSAAMICPGGAYGMLALRTEGVKEARWLASLGMHAFVLLYRHPAPLSDAKRAMQVVRAGAARFGIDPLRLGIVGFSAGGHLSATVAARCDGGRADPADDADAFPCRPASVVLVYPVITMDGAFAHRASRRNLLDGRAA